MAPKNKAKQEEAKTPASPDTLSNKQFMSMMNAKLKGETLYSFDGENTVKVQPVPTGIASLDYALGVGGFPLGRVIEVYGPESSGKTTIALYTVASFQKLAKIKGHPLYGKKAVFVDAEHALDPMHAHAIGVDISEEGLLILQPDSGESAYDAMVSMIQSGHVGLIVGDSLPAFIPKSVIDASAEDQHMMVAPRLNSKMIPIVTSHASKHDTLIIFINQIREKPTMHGNPEVTPGGRALKFMSSVRIDVRRKEIKKGEFTIGQEMTVKVKKNKVARPFTKTTFDYYFDGGVDTMKDIMNLAMELDIIKRAGAYYFYGEDKDNVQVDSNGNLLKWMGKEAVLEVLRQSPALYEYTNNLVQGNLPKEAIFVDEEEILSLNDPSELVNEEEADPTL